MLLREVVEGVRGRRQGWRLVLPLAGTRATGAEREEEEREEQNEEHDAWVTEKSDDISAAGSPFELNQR